MSTYTAALYESKSTLDNCPIGVFTSKDILSGAVICQHSGNVVTTEAVVRDHTTTYATSTGTIISCDSISNKINDIVDVRKLSYDETEKFFKSKELPKIAGVAYNCKFEETDGNVFVVAIADIAAYSELFIDFGANYWVFEFLKKSLIDYKYNITSISF